jgi:hypothetical protein
MKFLSLIPLIFYLLAALPMHYEADDFSDATGTGNIMGAIHGFYFGWSGRYIYGLTKTVSKLVPVWLPTVVVILALWWLIDNPLLVVAFFTVLPSIQTIWWNAGVTGYGLALVGIAACIKLRISGWTTLLLAFVTVGLSDTAAIAMPVVFACWYLLRHDRRAWFALAGTFVGLVVMMLSPGNAIRMTYFQRGDLFTALWFGLRTSGTFAADMLRAAPLSVLAVFTVPILSGVSKRRDNRRLFVLAIASLVGCFALSSFSYYSVGGPLVARAASIPVALLLVALYLGAYWSGWRLHKPRLAMAMTIAVFALGCVQALDIARRWVFAPTTTGDISTVLP